MWKLAAIALTAALAGCGGQTDAGGADAGDAGPEFVALQGDFANYTTWQSIDGGTEPVDNLPAGQRTIYLNQQPPTGSTQFAVGTIIVKTDDADGGQTFAMVKRGGGFNSGGANGWEWFGILPNSTGGGTIQWRGTAPPANQNYGPNFGSCNSCHQSFSNNDYVGGAAMQLGSF